MYPLSIKILIITNDPTVKNRVLDIIEPIQSSDNKLNILESTIFEATNTVTTYPTWDITIGAKKIEGIALLLENNKFAIVFMDYATLDETALETAKSIHQIDPEVQLVINYTIQDETRLSFYKDLTINHNLLICSKSLENITMRQIFLILAEKWILAQKFKDYNTTIENYVRERTENLEYKANHDPLTQLKNRNELELQLEHFMQNYSDNNLYFGVFFFDIDNFKWINDTYSHEIGDQVLKNLTKRIQNNIRKQDLFFRIGGDEFVILIPGIKDKKNFSTIGEHLLKVTKEPIVIANLCFKVSISVGITIYPTDGTELIHKADLAMYKAKSLGGNKLVVFNLSKQ